MIAITFFSGVQLLSLGVIGQYIGRLYREIKQRPLYIIKDKVGFDKGN
jgi:dolichol-phosphate mannosyltransferase